MIKLTLVVYLLLMSGCVAESTDFVGEPATDELKSDLASLDNFDEELMDLDEFGTEEFNF